MRPAHRQAMRSWWPQQLLLGWIHLVLTAPVIYLYVGLPLVMRQHGWSGTDIGLLQLSGLPAVLKFVLATPVDRWRWGRRSYRNWAIVLGLAYAAALLVLSAHKLHGTPYALLFLLAMLVSLLGTWADVPVNALAIQMLPASERMRAGAIRSAATSIGAIVGGGLMLMLHARLGWAWPLQVLALGLLSAVGLVPMLAVSAGQGTEPGIKQAGRPRAGAREWRAWFGIAEHRAWALLLVLYCPLIGAVWVYLKPLMLDQGFAPEQIALLVGVAGGLVAAVASMAGGRMSRRQGARRALPLFAACNLLALGMLAAAVMLRLGPGALIAACMGVALMMGASAGLVFGLMMYHARPGLSALDYGIQSSLFIAGRTVAPMLAGLLLDWGGYPGMLLGLMAGLALVLLLAWRVRERIFTQASPPGQGGDGSATLPGVTT